MTSNRDRAAKIIGREYMDAMSGPTPSAWRGQIAEALAAAGLLAPDLPAPSRTMFPGGRVWYIEGPVGDVRATNTGQVVAFGTWQEQPFRIVSTPERMRTLARTLEAAADHAEKAAAHAQKEETNE